MPEALGRITVAKRFLGPPHSANGGYICGRIAEYIGGAAEITLKKPPPLDTEMTVVRSVSGGVELLLDGELIATGRAANVAKIAISPPSLAQAEAAGQRTFPASRHPLPTCFVCGPHRAIGDGLCIQVGPVDAADDTWQGLMAAVWTPDASLANEDGVIRPEFLWAALDCPTAYAVSSRSGMRSVLLGRQTARIGAATKPGSAVIVAARREFQDGRKHTSHSWLFAQDGRLLAECQAVWIEVSAEVLRGHPG